MNFTKKPYVINVKVHDQSHPGAPAEFAIKICREVPTHRLANAAVDVLSASADISRKDNYAFEAFLGSSKLSFDSGHKASTLSLTGELA
jgi:hypothetical protein